MIALPVAGNKTIGVTTIGLITLLWGIAHAALGRFGDLPGNHWLEYDGSSGFTPVKWIGGDSFYNHLDIAFVGGS